MLLFVGLIRTEGTYAYTSNYVCIEIHRYSIWNKIITSTCVVIVMVIYVITNFYTHSFTTVIRYHGGVEGCCEWREGR